MTFRLPLSSKTHNLGLPDQARYDEIIVCKWCGTSCEKTDKCPKCRRKVTMDAIEPRREKDLVDLMSKETIEFRGLNLQQTIELINNGDCGEM